MDRYFNYKKIKEKHPNCVLLFNDGEEHYISYSEDADVLNDVLGCSTFDWDGIKGAGFPQCALDNYLPRLIRAGYRIAICDELRKCYARKCEQTEVAKPKRMMPVQLELFA